MDAQPETIAPVSRRKPFNWSVCILLPFLILLLYVFSFGPILMMLDTNRLNPSIEDALRAVYHPMWLAYVKTPLHKPLGMYLHLWLPDQIDENGDPLPGS